MNDFLNRDKKDQGQNVDHDGQFFDPKDQKTDNYVDAKPFDINNYGTLPKGVGTTQIKNRKEGIDQFLKRNDKHKSIDMDALKA